MFIVRYSEIGLKGNKTRRNMEKILTDNISSAIHNGPELKFKKSDGRIFIYSDSEELKKILKNIFGIKSFSIAREYTFNTMDEIVERIKTNYNEYVRNKKFAVIATRKGTHPFTSKELEIAAGDALYEYSGGVDLENPQAPVYVEVRDKNFYLFTEKIAGPGGLPLKSEGRAISLFSGGIDSPVSTYMVMKRGMASDLLFCSLAHPSDTVYMLEVAKNLIDKYSTGYDPTIFIIDGTSLITKILRNPDQKYTNLIFKEMLYLYAEKLCRIHDYDAIVTGESIGQVSSQIPLNLKSLSLDISFPIFRPLIGFDKEETIEYSKIHGLYRNDSIGEFCSLFSRNPGINIRPGELKKAMEDFNIDEYFKEIITLKGSNIENYLSTIKTGKVHEIDENMIAVDLRESTDYDKWHVPGAININVRDIDGFMSKAEKDRKYLFYCKKGLNSAYAVSMMVSEGFNAYYSTDIELKKISSKMHV